MEIRDAEFKNLKYWIKFKTQDGERKNMEIEPILKCMQEKDDYSMSMQEVKYSTLSILFHGC